MVGVERATTDQDMPLSMAMSPPAATIGPSGGKDGTDLSPSSSYLGRLTVLGEPWQSPPEALLS